MAHQDNPNIYPLNVRITQSLRRRLELLAARRGYDNVASFARDLLIRETAEVPLTPDDYRIIADRVAARGEVLRDR